MDESQAISASMVQRGVGVREKASGKRTKERDNSERDDAKTKTAKPFEELLPENSIPKITAEDEPNVRVEVGRFEAKGICIIPKEDIFKIVLNNSSGESLRDDFVSNASTEEEAAEDGGPQIESARMVQRGNGADGKASMEDETVGTVFNRRDVALIEAQHAWQAAEGNEAAGEVGQGPRERETFKLVF